MASNPSRGNEKEARNQALFADYLGAGYSQKALASKYDLTAKGLESLLARHDVKLPSKERSRRRIGRKLGPRNPPAPKRGRKAAWPDCPPEMLPEYMRLRNKGIPAAEARALLDKKREIAAVRLLAAMERERTRSVELALSCGALRSPLLERPDLVNRAYEREAEQALLLNTELSR